MTEEGSDPAGDHRRRQPSVLARRKAAAVAADPDPDPDSDPRLTLLDRPVPGWARTQLITIEAGWELPYVAGDWFDALVLVERGGVVLLARDGTCTAHATGSVLFLVGLPLTAVQNHGSERAVLLRIARTRERVCRSLATADDFARAVGTDHRPEEPPG